LPELAVPRNASASAYGPEYEALLTTAAAQGGFLLTLPSPRAAFLFRLKVYGYFKALRAEGKRGDLVVAADRFALAVSGREFKMTLKSDAWDAIALREALSMAPPTLPTGPRALTSMTQRLAELRKNKVK
jgi:hypothetical protein